MKAFVVEKNHNDEIISGRLTALGQTRQFHSKPFTNRVRTEGHTGITVPSMKVDFTMPETVVTGQRMTAAKVSGIRSSIPSIPLAVAEPGKSLPGSVQGTPDFSQDQLYVEFPALLFGSLPKNSRTRSSSSCELPLARIISLYLSPVALSKMPFFSKTENISWA